MEEDDERGEELADVVLTLLEFRGILSLEALPPLLRQLAPERSGDLDASAVQALLEGTDTAYESMFRIEDGRLVHAALSRDDVPAVASGQARHAGVPPYMPTPEDLAEEDLYWLGGQPEFADALVGALEDAGVPEEDAFELAWAAFYWDNADAGRDPDAVFQRLVDRIGAPVGLEGLRRLRMAFDRWSRLHPSWVLHGRTEEEASRLKPLRAVSPDSRILHPDFGTGRNDPCPCGSGKKYKNCHGR